jgi:thioesterase domain-containing protein
MIPASFTPIARIPLLASGKVDRSALPKPSGPGLGDAPAVAPSNDVEAWLVEIWESVLGISSFGVCDSFFDLGGNSLQAAAVVSQVEERVNRRVPPAIFLTESTIRQLAEYLCREDRYPSGIVPIQIGSGPALYLIHPQVITRLVSEKLGSQHTVIGVEIPATELPGLKPMASEIARKIREYQPNPPYRLAGWCSYGNLAYEIAQQLHDAGKPVDLVILFESINFSRTRSFGHWYERIRWHLSHLRQKPVSEITPYIREGLREARRFAKRLARFAKYRLRSRAVDPKSSQPISPGDIPALISASYDYVPKPYSGEVVLFRPDIRMHGLNHDPSLGWASVVRKLQVIDVPGNHFTMFDSPNVDVVAAQLAELLARR